MIVKLEVRKGTTTAEKDAYYFIVFFVIIIIFSLPEFSSICSQHSWIIVCMTKLITRSWRIFLVKRTESLSVFSFA